MSSRAGIALKRVVPAASALLMACGDPMVSSTRSSRIGEEPSASREKMVVQQIEARGVADPRVLAAMRKVPRHEFVPPGSRDSAYQDRPLSIGHDQTISQPYMVAVMAELARLQPDGRVLEIGTGSGYQAAILAELVSEVFTIEIIEALAASAGETLERLGYGSIHVRHGDGYRGWPAASPFDAILVTAAIQRVPPALLDQMTPGGRLVIPLGPTSDTQKLRVFRKAADGRLSERDALSVRFVPLL